MKLQLTKTKTIEIRLPGGFGDKTAAGGLSDVTGIELDYADPLGCPAVRIVRKRGQWHIAAAGFVPPPAAGLPTSWETSSKAVEWSLPPEFQSSGAALAVFSEETLLRQTTPDSLVMEIGVAGTAPAETKAEPALKKKLGVIRALPKAAKPTTEGAAPIPSVSFEPGVPVSLKGFRVVTQPLAEKPFILATGMPEYQVLWSSRLLPEGRRPTVYSVQATPAAMLASVIGQPAFTEAGGTAFVIFVTRTSVFFAGYKDGALMMFRPCPGVSGFEAIRESVKTRLGLDEELVDAMLDDSVIDPRPVLEPFVRPVLQQAEISLEYLENRHGLQIDHLFLMGLPSGGRYWNLMAQETLHRSILTPSAFDGYVCTGKKKFDPVGLTSSQTSLFLAALGAARAAGGAQ